MTNDKDALRVRLINIICGDVLPTYNHVTKADMVITAVEEPLRARIAELEAALKPFIEGFDEDWVEALKTAKDSDWLRMVATAGTIRAARAAYLGEKE